MTESCDIAIVGGAAIGAACACFLTADPAFRGRLVVIERDPSYRSASTALSAAGIRQQFTTEINVRIGLYGAEFIRSFKDAMAVEGTGPDLQFRESGYLYLAASAEQEADLRAAHAVQRAAGADVVLWDAAGLKAAYPHLNTGDIRLASWGRSGEGWFDNVGLMAGLRAKARAQGAQFLHDEVTGIRRDGGRVVALQLKSGAELAAGLVVNAAGPRAGALARMAGLSLPVEPRKRTLFVFACAASPEGSARVAGGRLPLMIDSSGVFVRPEGRFFLAGTEPDPDPAVAFDDFEPRDDEFEAVIWPALAARSPAFEALKVVNRWAGHYDYNSFDQNLILGPHPELPNFVFANGFSGHGLQQAPAVGRAVAELVLHGGFRTLDLSAAGYERIAANLPLREGAVIA